MPTQEVGFKGGKTYFEISCGATTWFIETRPENGERIGTINYPGNVKGKPYHAIPKALELTADIMDENHHFETRLEAVAFIIKTHEAPNGNHPIYDLARP